MARQAIRYRVKDYTFFTAHQRRMRKKTNINSSFILRSMIYALRKSSSGEAKEFHRWCQSEIDRILLKIKSGEIVET